MYKSPISYLFGKRNGSGRWKRTSGLLVQKSFRYEHHLKNYEESLKTGLIPNGLRIKKSAAITPVMEDFHRKWQQILYDAEKNLVELLLYEANQVVAKIQIDLDGEIRKINPKNYD